MRRPPVLLLLASSFLLVIVAVSALDAVGSPNPPPNGDWTVGTGETVTLTGVTLDLRGDLHVRGTLELDNSTLWVWLDPSAPRELVVHPGGMLRLVNSVLVSQDLGRPYVLQAEDGSGLLLDRSSVFRAGDRLTLDGRLSGVWVATDDASVRGSQFMECLVGVWAAAKELRVTDCDMAGCRYGAVVDAGGNMLVDNAQVQLCTFGLLANASSMTVVGSTVTDCDEGILAYGGNLTVRGTDVNNCTVVGVGGYSAELTVSDTTVRYAEADGVYVQASRAWISSCRFSGLDSDVRVVHSEAWLSGNYHQDTYDEAMWMYHSTFHVRDAFTNGSYWALRGWKSTGECLNLTAVNATYGAHLERCDDVLLDGLHMDQKNRTRRQTARGLYITGGSLTLRNATITGVRTGIDMLSAAADVRWVRIDDCYQDGIMVSLSWEFVMSDVNVTRADDGYWLNLYSGGRLERCVASLCRATGFNFSAGATTVLLECNASANPVGVMAQYASPTLLDCEMYMCDHRWELTNETLAMDLFSGSPRIIGGSVVGGLGGIRLNNTHALIENVSFTGMERWAVQALESTGDVLRGCHFHHLRTANGVFAAYSGTVIEDCTFFHVNYGISGSFWSYLVVEGNTFENVTYDAIFVLMNSTVESRGNRIHDVGYYAIHAMYQSHVISTDDVYSEVASRSLFIWLGSTLRMAGGSITDSPVGVYGDDALLIDVSYTEFRNLTRGIVSYKMFSKKATATQQHLRVEGCYMTNHSAYAIGAFDVNLTVVDCNFLDNIAAVRATNSTVDMLDCSMVGSWIFGLRAEGSSKVTWTVRGMCRILSSDLYGHIDLRVEGGKLIMEDNLFEPAAASSLRSTAGSRVRVRACLWRANGAGLRLVGSDVELVNTTFTAVGPILGGGPGTLGVSVSGGSLEVRGCTFKRARTGLSLVDTVAVVRGTQFSECGEAGIYARGSDVELLNIRINRTMVGSSIHLVGSTMHAERSSASIGTDSLTMLDSQATMVNCSVGGASNTCLSINGSDLVLVNTTYQTDRLDVTSGGEVEVWWLVSARVLWPDREELGSARVWVRDAKGAEVARGRPDAGGNVRWMPVLSLVHQADGDIDHGPHQAWADLFGYSVSETVRLTSSTNVLLDLKDVDPPSFQVLEPALEEIWTRSGSLTVIGRAVDTGSGTEEVRVFTDFNPTSMRSDGEDFAFQLQLTDGRHQVELRARDLAGNEARYEFTVWVETDPLAMSPPDPGNGTLTDARSVTLRGRLSRVEGVTVRVNNALADVDQANRSYSIDVDLVEGPNRLSVLAVDWYGHETWWNLSITADWTPPDLVMTSELNVNTTDEWVEISGHVDADAELFIQGSMVLLRQGSFYVKYPVYVGETAITVKAEDEIGNHREVQVLVFRREVDTEPPGPNPWEPGIFLVIIPILLVAVYVVLQRLRFGGEGP